MAAAVAETLADRGILLCEAGTGIGKTLAYLVPAIRSGLRLVVSTGTRNLQDQLFHRDLPLALEALAAAATVALLKGRGNYLCLQRLRATSLGGHQLDATIEADLQRIRTWAGRTVEGDIAELGELSETAPAWRHATSTVENCLGQECPAYADCHVVKARRRAMEADIVVVNHHLFFADLALREDGFGELLPGADAVILDEAHQLPEIGARFFGTAVGAGQLRELAQDTRRACLAGARDVEGVEPRILALEHALERMRHALGSGGRRMAWVEALALPDVEPASAGLAAALGAVAQMLDPLSVRDLDLAGCHRRAAGLVERLALLRDESDDGRVRWIEPTRWGFTWHASPIEIAGHLGPHLRGGRRAWILTSATLAVGGRLDHFVERLGLDGDARTEVWGSPFDYRAQSLCLLPRGMPEPRDPTFRHRLLDLVVPLLEASEGRAFVLCTSHQGLKDAARGLYGRVRFPLLVQGEAPRSELLRQFVSTPGAVLLGTHSFWEGVDVRGDALGCVIIDKLPFAAPDDPVLKARIEHLRRDGRDPFSELQLPHAVIALKQGVGRLIRDHEDRGLVVLCDPRLASRGYGRVFLASLPPMPRTDDLDEALDFLRDMRARRREGAS